MGKRGGHKKKQFNNNNKPEEKKSEVWRDHKVVHENTYFKSYYQIQLAPYFVGREAEFEEFWAAMKIRLPVVFRINPNQPNYAAFAHKISAEEWLKDQVVEEETLGQYEPQEQPKIERIEWFPQKLAYTLNTNKQVFKKSKKLAALHAFIQKATDSGLITRQELVSMLPPIFLDVQPDDIVLDMCAAPGSKTSQMLEMLYQQQRTLSKGCVIANDVEYSRAQMLIHQVQRSGTAGMAVINHSGQFLPQLHYKPAPGSNEKRKFLFNKILCDVPCSGDGATRKLPNKWSNWHTNDGIALHPLQLSILIKGINLLAEDGYLLYSTCSINPVEDEAVILELMRQIESGLEIIDIHSKFNFKGRAGLLNWKVLESTGREVKVEEAKKIHELFVEHEKYDAEKVSKKIKPSMFPESPEVMAHIGIHKTMRLLPHDLNSGGFYVALLKKNKGFKWKSTSEILVTAEEEALKDQQAQNQYQENGAREEGEGKMAVEEEVVEQKQGDEEEQVQEEKQQKPEGQQNVAALELKPERKPKRRQLPKRCEQYITIQQEDFNSLKEFYGLPENFKRLLYVRKDTVEHRKKVTLVSESITNFLEADDDNKRIKLINMGCKAFEKGKQTFAGTECLYRLCQDAIHFVLPLMSKRRVKISLDLFKKLLNGKDYRHDDIENEQERKAIKEITQGAFALYIEEQIHGKTVIDALVAQNFKNNLNLMVCKEDMESLRIRYL